MARRQNKRGLMAPQPAAQIAALDRVYCNEAYRRSVDVFYQMSETGDNAAESAAWDAVQRTADALISVPAVTPAQVRDKFAAFAMLHTDAADLHRSEQQRQVAAYDDDAAKGALAIYLDLDALASPDSGAPALWDEPKRLALSPASVATLPDDALMAMHDAFAGFDRQLTAVMNMPRNEGCLEVLDGVLNWIGHGLTALEVEAERRPQTEKLAWMQLRATARYEDDLDHIANLATFLAEQVQAAGGKPDAE